MVSCSRKRSSRKSTCTSDLSTSALTNSSTSSGPTSPPPQMCSAADRVNPEAKTERRLRTHRSLGPNSPQLHSMEASKVRCRSGAAHPLPTSRRNLSERPWAMRSMLINRARAAASSRARGMPSRRAQISATAAAPLSSTENPGNALLARSTKSWPASDPSSATAPWTELGSSRPSTLTATSPVSPMT